jgi:crotonobetainyl-CoA:carnitine CoA-transferase CaiB-like acyl-CoA transferase
MVKSYEHPAVGTVRGIDMPYRFSETEPRRLLSPPRLGEHTVEVLRTMAGLSDGEIDQLLHAKVIWTHAA